MTEKDYFDSIEQFSLKEYADHIEKDLLEQVQYVYNNSPFYRNKLDKAGVDPEAIDSIDDITFLPFTEKETLRKRQKQYPPFGDYRICDLDDIARVYTSSGTTGRPTFIGLTESDLDCWTTVSARAAYAAGLRPSDTIIGSTAGGPFVAAIAYDGYQRLGASVAPVGPRQTDRIITMLKNDCGTALAGTPSYIEYFLEEVRDRGIDPETLGLDQVLVGGEPGAENLRQEVENAFNCSLTESMGNGDVSISIWGECVYKNGMHFTGQGLVYPELIDPETGDPKSWTNNAQGELVYTAINRECLPLLRFRTHDHVVVTETDCDCGRGSVCIRGLGRTDNMFIVRGVNVFPSAVKDLVSEFDETTGHLRIHLDEKDGQSVEAPVDITLEVTDDTTSDIDERLESRIRENLQFQADIKIVPEGTLERSEYKSSIVEYQ